MDLRFSILLLVSIDAHYTFDNGIRETIDVKRRIQLKESFPGKQKRVQKTKMYIPVLKIYF